MVCPLASDEGMSASKISGDIYLMNMHFSNMCVKDNENETQIDFSTFLSDYLVNEWFTWYPPPPPPPPQ